MITKKTICRTLLSFTIFMLICFPLLAVEKIRISTQQREPAVWDKNARSVTNRIEQWKPEETAIIVCDMWDKHWCKHSTVRFAELAVALNPVLNAAREKGVLIVHSPSDVMTFYKDYPQRKESQKYADESLKPLTDGSPLPLEKGQKFPIDASDEGCECTPKCKIYRAWTRQTETITIGEHDLISDLGTELGGYFKEKGIKNVILTGVATNMCVMKRPFGIRTMKKLGLNVVLMRDMTDVMYNPAMPPKVDHFSGLDLMVNYIETFVCPSIVSTDITGKKPFRFSDDRRKRIALVIAEGEYHANQRLPEFAEELTRKNYHCGFALGVPRMNGEGRHNIENLQILEDADLMILYARRRALAPEKMAMIKEYVASGRPIFAIRTSSAAFDAQKPIKDEQGNVLEQWKEFDKDILGGNYQGYDSDLRKQGTGTDVTIVAGKENHPLLKGVQPFHCQDWMYKNTPLRSDKAEVLLRGKNPKLEEPVLWTNGSNAVYTSLGHWDDWTIDSYKTLTHNIVEYLLNDSQK
ncbi:MAG: isochorismatase family protein [Planctomycetaceae bacterium]|jgi:nicotinamidase-related amidase|nr:isochorismatase family protein [Planctomycetaceae bacterium]